MERFVPRRDLLRLGGEPTARFFVGAGGDPRLSSTRYATGRRPGEGRWNPALGIPPPTHDRKVPMPEHRHTTATLYRHWVSFASGEQPFAVVLPDRKLYDAFASWLGGDGPQGHSFPYERQEMSINFAHVQRMEV